MLKVTAFVEVNGFHLPAFGQSVPHRLKRLDVVLLIATTVPAFLTESKHLRTDQGGGASLMVKNREKTRVADFS